eukprot:scaffold75216_cov28-Tisochrysis_lutea.AAC.1
MPCEYAPPPTGLQPWTCCSLQLAWRSTLVSKPRAPFPFPILPPSHATTNPFDLQGGQCKLLSTWWSRS